MSGWTCTSCGGANPEGTKFCGHCGAPADGAGTSADGGDVADALRSFVAGPVADRLIEARGNIPEERRLVTALFADVSGFTALAERLDPEQLLEVIDPVIAALSSVVGRHGGYVEKFAGDALMALFGAPVSHEDDAARAVRVALEMHTELARIVPRLPQEATLTLHVGINSGHGIARILGSEARMDYAVLGDAVILAQRLESAAPPGETYVSDTTVRLTENDFDFEPVGELTLKGKAEPVPAWRLVGERQRGAVAGRRTLVGREAELAVVDQALAELDAGRGSVLVITGEPGIGKSRLAEAARSRTNVASLQARCLSYGVALPYWPYVDLVRRFAALHSEEDPATTREQLANALTEAGVAETAPFFARLLGLPVDDDDVSGLEPEAFRRGLHDAVSGWVAGMAPLVITLEDVHWMDPSSFELTADLIRGMSATPSLFVLVARPEAHDELEQLSGERRHWIELGPLALEDTRLLAATILDGPAPAELVDFVERRTSGNPFFVEELVRALRDRDVLVLETDGWKIRSGWDERDVPPTVEGVLAARIDLLSREAGSLLQTAAVIGRRLPLPLLEKVAADGAIERPVAELLRSGFLDRIRDQRGEALMFHHALVQDVAYSRLLRRRRRELHLRVAEAAEALYGSGEHVIDLLARHLYLADSPRAEKYLVRAGTRAKRLFANEEAILHLERARELAPDDADVLLALADLYELVGRYDDALSLYREVRDATNEVRAWAGMAATLRKQGAYDDSLAVVNEAFATESLKGADLVPLWIENSWTLAVSGHYEQAIDVLVAALAAVGKREDTLVGRLLLELTVSEMFTGRLAEAVEHGLRAERILEEHDDTIGLAKAMRVLGSVYEKQDRLDEAARMLRRGVTLAERVGSVEELGGSLINLGIVEMKRDALDDAIACDRRAIEEFERVGHGSGRAIGYANLAEKLMLAGSDEEALETAEHALELSRAIGLSYTIADLTKTIASLQLRRGELEGAVSHAEAAAELFVEIGALPGAAQALDVAAEAWARAGESERATETSDRARSFAASG
jgi:class 3 adenylate cyclase/tetratricopeptide (TPR) repeat protein